ncbi:MAG: glycosyltransferase family 4 protein [Eubacterium sp.]|nr:glycosyltransferase family 4 protein [Eubacterium sp.]
MNIVYIDHYAGSPDMGMEFRPYYLAREWVKMGHSVSMIAGDFSHLRKINPTVSQDMQRQRIDGIDYYWLKSGQYEGNGFRRAFSIFRFCRKLSRWKRWIAKTLQPDVVISSSTYPVDSIVAQRICRCTDRKLRRSYRTKHIHEIHDMWPSTLKEIGGMSARHPFVIMMQYGENYAYKHADAVVSMLGHAEAYMREHGLAEGKFFHIPNGIVLDEWESPAPLPEKHQKRLGKLRADGSFIVGYFGGHALSNCLMTLIEAAGKLDGEAGQSIRFVLVGDGVEKKKLKKTAKKRGLKNITFLPSVNKKAIPTLVESFDCTYIGTVDSPLYRFGACMNKMYDGMMAGKPVIFAINAPPTPVEQCGCGIIVPPEDTDEIVKAVRKLASMSAEERKEMGQRGKDEVLKNNTYRKLAEDFLRVMETK